jgi:hypothetical protein
LASRGGKKTKKTWLAEEEKNARKPWLALKQKTNKTLLAEEEKNEKNLACREGIKL